MPGSKRAYVPVPGTRLERTGYGGLLPSIIVWTAAGKTKYNALCQLCKQLGIGLVPRAEAIPGGEYHGTDRVGYRVWGVAHSLLSLTFYPVVDGWENWTADASRPVVREDGSTPGQRLGPMKRPASPPRNLAAPIACLQFREETPLPSLDRHTFMNGEGI